MNELHLFAGCGGGILGGILLGHRTVCAVEIEPFRRKTLLQRQRDGLLPWFPIWDDVRTFDGIPWSGLVDVVAGGFPCKGVSAAGNGTGLEHRESGLWREEARIIGEVGPRIVFVENSPLLTSRGLDIVLGDLAEMGYDARWGVLSAADAIWLGGTPCLDHLRERIWIFATRRNADFEGLERRDCGGLCEHAGQRAIGEANSPVADRQEIGCNARGLSERASEANALFAERGQEAADSDQSGQPGPKLPVRSRRQEQAEVESFGARFRDAFAHAYKNGREQMESENVPGARGERSIDPPAESAPSWWESEPSVGRVVHGVANRVDRIGAIGDGQVPAVVRLAWEILSSAPGC